MKRKQPRPARINRIVKRLARRYERQRILAGGKKPMKRREVKSRAAPLIAYDLETTRIKSGTPQPLYITVFGENMNLSSRVRDIEHLGEILATQILTVENKRARFVAWNGNNFDVYFIGAALLHHPEYILRPYLTRSKSLRGLKVISKDNKKLSWEFLDGIAMTGLQGRTLKSFLAVFAPEYQKLQSPDFENEDFNADNPEHVKYAERDSEGLYYGIKAAQDIVFEHFGVLLQPTIGNMGIRVFMRNMPENIQVWEPSLELLDVIRDYVMRGGYCHCVKKYKGLIWKYDINQAYAAAMRETALPAGRAMRIKGYSKYAKTAVYRITARNPRNKIPFYCINQDKESVFAVHDIPDTWITSIELEQLRAEKWDIDIIDGYLWDDFFSMKNYVDKLEHLRITAPDGVNGALGLMVKAIGNNSYGKTVEQLDGLELIMSLEKPDGFYEYQPDDDKLRHIWFKINKPVPREYHQPQIGAFITAYVRMVVRRAALLAPDQWLYADTDCVIFSKPVKLPIDPKKYGYWKEENAGDEYYIIEKKVYSDMQAKVKHAKGMNIKRLTADDFAKWYEGEAPRQKQIHKNNFVGVMTGREMFFEHEKVGQINARKGA